MQSIISSVNQRFFNPCPLSYPVEEPISNKYYLQLSDHSLIDLFKLTLQDVLVNFMPIEESPFLQLQKQLYCIYSNTEVKQSQIIGIMIDQMRNACKLQRKLIDMSYMQFNKEKDLYSDMRDQNVLEINFTTTQKSNQSKPMLKKIYGIIGILILNSYQALSHSIKQMQFLLKHLIKERLITASNFQKSKKLNETLNSIIMSELLVETATFDPKKILPTLSQNQKQAFVFSNSSGVSTRRVLTQYVPHLYDDDPPFADVFFQRQQKFKQMQKQSLDEDILQFPQSQKTAGMNDIMKQLFYEQIMTKYEDTMMPFFLGGTNNGDLKNYAKSFKQFYMGGTQEDDDQFNFNFKPKSSLLEFFKQNSNTLEERDKQATTEQQERQKEIKQSKQKQQKEIKQKQRRDLQEKEKQQKETEQKQAQQKQKEQKQRKLQKQQKQQKQQNAGTPYIKITEVCKVTANTDEQLLQKIKQGTQKYFQQRQDAVNNKLKKQQIASKAVAKKNKQLLTEKKEMGICDKLRAEIKYQKQVNNIDKKTQAAMWRKRVAEIMELNTPKMTTNKSQCIRATKYFDDTIEEFSNLDHNSIGLDNKSKMIKTKIDTSSELQAYEIQIVKSEENQSKSNEHRSVAADFAEQENQISPEKDQNKSKKRKRNKKKKNKKIGQVETEQKKDISNQKLKKLNELSQQERNISNYLQNLQIDQKNRIECKVPQCTLQKWKKRILTLRNIQVR